MNLPRTVLYCTLGCSKIGGTRPPPYAEIPDFRKYVPDHPELLRKCQKWIRHEILQFLESKIFFLTPSEEKVIKFSYPSVRGGGVHQFCCNLEYQPRTAWCAKDQPLPHILSCYCVRLSAPTRVATTHLGPEYAHNEHTPWSIDRMS